MSCPLISHWPERTPNCRGGWECWGAHGLFGGNQLSLIHWLSILCWKVGGTGWGVTSLQSWKQNEWKSFKSSASTILGISSFSLGPHLLPSPVSILPSFLLLCDVQWMLTLHPTWYLCCLSKEERYWCSCWNRAICHGLHLTLRPSLAWKPFYFSHFLFVGKSF